MPLHYQSASILAGANWWLIGVTCQDDKKGQLDQLGRR